MQFFQNLSKNLKQVTALYHKVPAKQLSPLELNHYVEILVTISTKKHPLTQGQLAGLFKIDISRMKNILFNLSQQELIYTVRNPEDRSEHFVYLTAKQKKLFQLLKMA